jgi:hypothetical protein
LSGRQNGTVSREVRLHRYIVLRNHTDALADQFFGSNAQHLADYLVAIQDGRLGRGAIRNHERGLYSVEGKITQR